MSTNREQVIAAHQAAVTAAEAKIAKLEAHLDGARDGLAEAEKALADAESADYPDGEDGEHVVARAGRADGSGEV